MTIRGHRLRDETVKLGPFADTVTSTRSVGKHFPRPRCIMMIVCKHKSAKNCDAHSSADAFQPSSFAIERTPTTLPTPRHVHNTSMRPTELLARHTPSIPLYQKKFIIFHALKSQKWQRLWSNPRKWKSGFTPYGKPQFRSRGRKSNRSGAGSFHPFRYHVHQRVRIECQGSNSSHNFNGWRPCTGPTQPDGRTRVGCL